MDVVLLHALGKGTAKRTPEHDFDDGSESKVKVYVVDGKISFCKMWNSSNNNYFDLKTACSLISDKFMEDEDLVEGTVSVGFSEIWFEIVEKDL